MLTESVVRFQAEGMMETFPAAGPVKTKVLGKETKEREESAIRVQNDMNYQLTEVMTEYRPEHEKLLWSLPLAGSAFKKVYYDPSLGRQVAMFIPAEDIVVPYGAPSLERSERVTHVMRKTENEVIKLQEAGFYRDVDLGEPGGAIIIVMTRWSKLDLTGQIISQMAREEGVDPWEVVEFPAILNEKPLWGDFWSIEELLSKKAGMDVRYWEAQYMQNPVSEEGALIKREWWQIWDQDKDPPHCEFIIMSLDAAQEANTRADYNALTTWGVFMNEESKNYNIILLNAIKKRLEFPELKKMVLEEYKEWEPDAFVVEKKSNGSALYQEFRRMGVPVSEFTPGKGQDKISRVNAVSDLFSAGIVWAPDRRWAKEVIEECNDFPSGMNDDLVDSTSQALARFRQGGFIKLPNDEPEDIKWFKGYRGRERFYTV